MDSPPVETPHPALRRKTVFGRILFKFVGGWRGGIGCVGVFKMSLESIEHSYRYVSANEIIIQSQEYTRDMY